VERTGTSRTGEARIGSLTERLNGYGLVVHDVEDGIQPCNLHHIVNLIREVEQLHLPLLLPHAGESTDQMAQS
jgi:hypothetical protein